MKLRTLFFQARRERPKYEVSNAIVIFQSENKDNFVHQNKTNKRNKEKAKQNKQTKQRKSETDKRNKNAKQKIEIEK